MNTGILSISLRQLPYQFGGLRVISIIVYLVKLCVFVAFLSMFGMRMLLYLDSSAFRMVVTAITLFLVIIWWGLALFTIWNWRAMLNIPKNDKVPENWHEA